MAEKEERILCIETYEKIAECGYGDFYNTITRQEAINRMAKALHRESTRISNMEKDFDKLYADWRKSFYNYAEAALNALLSSGE